MSFPFDGKVFVWLSYSREKRKKLHFGPDIFTEISDGQKGLE